MCTEVITVGLPNFQTNIFMGTNMEVCLKNCTTTTILLLLYNLTIADWEMVIMMYRDDKALEGNRLSLFVCRYYCMCARPKLVSIYIIRKLNAPGELHVQTM